ncbi:MAG: TRZ/ATZ family hydrolase, partial [Gammaproteobacteria bacterium]|nr:TRZ/ATZ family hydrolase [Gammaproteobacteria bacterium]
FINTHTHAAMTLMRGLADDLPLMEWLSEHIWPAEGQHVNYQFVKDGSDLAIAEMIRSGTTTFNDMYFFPDATAKSAEEAGIRVSLGLIMIDFPSAWAKDSEDYLHKGLQLHEQYRHHPLISTAFAPHAPYTVSDGPLEQIKIYAEKLDIPIHIHLHETQDEVNDSVSNTGMRPIARLEKLGLLSPLLIAVHMTQLEDYEIELLKHHGVHIVHCPESNLKLASGFCPVGKLSDSKINTAIGTDGAASNNDLDMLSEMRTTALLSKAVAENASIIPAHVALKMATLNGAKALGLDSITGSLSNGKAADITAIDLKKIETQPIFNPISQIVYSSSREQITDVWVQGKHLLNNRHLTTLDTEQILQKAKKWGDKIQLKS